MKKEQIIIDLIYYLGCLMLGISLMLIWEWKGFLLSIGLIMVISTSPYLQVSNKRRNK